MAANRHLDGTVIRDLYRTGCSIPALARRFECSETSIRYHLSKGAPNTPPRKGLNRRFRVPAEVFGVEGGRDVDRVRLGITKLGAALLDQLAPTGVLRKVALRQVVRQIRLAAWDLELNERERPDGGEEA